MHLELRPSSPDDRAAILNLGTYYLYDLLPYQGDGPDSRINPFGIIAGGAASTHDQASAEQQIWWTKPGILLPMLIRVDDEPAGFAQVAHPRMPIRPSITAWKTSSSPTNSATAASAAPPSTKSSPARARCLCHELAT